MTRFLPATTFRPPRSLALRCLGLGVLAFGCVPQADAASLSSSKISQAFKHDWAQVKNFFEGHHHSSPALHLTNADGSLNTASPVVQHLEWRRNQDPTLFDSRYPRLGQLLSGSTGTVTAASLPTTATASVSQPSQTAAYQVLIPPATAGSGPASTWANYHAAIEPAAQTLTVPEPASLACSLALLGGAAAWRKLRRNALGALEADPGCPLC